MGSAPRAEFDRFATSYDEALAKGLSVSGEDKRFFAQGRVAWLARCLAELNEVPKSYLFSGVRPSPGAETLERQSDLRRFSALELAEPAAPEDGRTPLNRYPKSVLDFGCGTGSSSPYLLELSPEAALIGTDISSKSIEEAQRSYGSSRAKFLSQDCFAPHENIDLAFCNGVFHHIPARERAAAVQLVRRALKPGGLFAFWDNNPWNPGTRYVMHRIPFDRHAVMLSATESKRLLQANGFAVLRCDFLFIFPRLLAWFRRFEAALSKWPIGAQYQVLCRKV